MEVTVALDLRYSIAPDGSVWSQFGMARQFWERYLEVFDSVRVIARATPVAEPPAGWQRVNSDNIVVHALPDFHGPLECLLKYPVLRSAIRAAAPSRGAVILRVGSLVANVIEGLLIERKRPYALEVVGDPYEVFAPGVVTHPLRAFFRWHFSRRLRQQCRNAAGVAYVTKHSLQKRYPARSMAVSISDVDLPEEALADSGFLTSYSSVELQSHDIVAGIHQPRAEGPFRIVTVGSLAQLYKGTDVLIDAVARCVRGGLDLTAVIAGDGKYRQQLAAQAEHEGVASRVHFLGQVGAGEPVRRLLDTADLFVFPSRTEGMPRALIEAMARGLPCIGSAVGGIPELLDAGDLVPPGDAVALAAGIQAALADPPRREAMARRNLDSAREFSASVLAQRRRRFYQFVRDSTQSWDSRRSV
jgi:glycosyltransferase involved in cell wall biosynthesis